MNDHKKRAYLEVDGELRYALKVLAALKRKSAKALTSEALLATYPELEQIRKERDGKRDTVLQKGE